MGVPPGGDILLDTGRAIRLAMAPAFLLTGIMAGRRLPSLEAA